MTRLYFAVIMITALLPLSVKAGVGDSYICLSSQYLQVKEDGGIDRYRPIKFKFMWVSPADSTEQSIWFPDHPELIVAATAFLIGEKPDWSEGTEEMISFSKYGKSLVDQSGGLFTNGKLYLAYSSSAVSKSITSLIATCEKTNH